VTGAGKDGEIGMRLSERDRELILHRQGKAY